MSIKGKETFGEFAQLNRFQPFSCQITPSRTNRIMIIVVIGKARDCSCHNGLWTQTATILKEKHDPIVIIILITLNDNYSYHCDPHHHLERRLWKEVTVEVAEFCAAG